MLHRSRARRVASSLTVTRLGPSFAGQHGWYQARGLIVLALESSADDSCAAIVTSDRQILSNVVIKQHHLNVKHGGIHPLEAQHAHERNVVSLDLSLQHNSLTHMSATRDLSGFTRGSHED